MDKEMINAWLTEEKVDPVETWIKENKLNPVEEWLASKPVSPMSREKMWEALDRDGFVVIRKALPKSVCEFIYGEFMDYMEKLTNGRFKRDELETWLKSMPPTTKNLFQHYNVGYTRASIDCRMSGKHIYDELHGTEKLICSNDGTSFSKKNVRPKYKDLKDWREKNLELSPTHIDQTTLDVPGGYRSVQGGFSFTNQPIDGHCFAVVRGSHKYHADVLRIAEAELEEKNRGVTDEKKMKKMKKNWYVGSPAVQEFLQLKGLFPERIPLEEGDCMLWLSKTFHTSFEYCKTAPEDTKRLQIFVCMAPVSYLTKKEYEKQIKKRLDMYADGRVSKHDPLNFGPFSNQPHIWGQRAGDVVRALCVPKSAKMSEAEMKLHCLKSYFK